MFSLVELCSIEHYAICFASKWIPWYVTSVDLDTPAFVHGLAWHMADYAYQFSSAYERALSRLKIDITSDLSRGIPFLMLLEQVITHDMIYRLYLFECFNPEHLVIQEGHDLATVQDIAKKMFGIFNYGSYAENFLFPSFH